jgi:hypothetical protein
MLPDEVFAEYRLPTIVTAVLALHFAQILAATQSRMQPLLVVIALDEFLDVALWLSFFIPPRSAALIRQTHKFHR